MSAPPAFGASVPWTTRLYARAPFPPLATGLAVSVAWYGVFLAYTAALGAGPGELPRLGGAAWAPEIFWSLLIGLAPAVGVLSARGAERDLEALAPALGAEPAALETLRRAIAAPPGAPLRAVGAAGLAFATLVIALEPDIWAAGRVPPRSDPEFLWILGRNALAAWLLARAAVLELLLARAFSRLGERLSRVDLLDHGPLLPFGRRALRGVLLWMLYLALFAPLWALGAAEPELGLAVVLLLAVAGAAFLVPVWGARTRLRRAKAEELGRVRRALAAARERALDGGGDASGGGRLADLVAWEGRVAAAGEWPFGAPTLARLALYVAIGLGSWLGAALVERALERALG